MTFSYEQFILFKFGSFYHSVDTQKETALFLAPQVRNRAREKKH